MRIVNRAGAPIAALVLAALLAGCHGGSTASTAPANTAVNPGPNPTTGDPGPNNTANGPQTLQGTLLAHSGCFELDGNAANEARARFQLEFAGETVKQRGTTIVISGPDGERTVGPHDTVYVAGRPGSGTGPCGRVFRVEKVVSVTPAG